MAERVEASIGREAKWQVGSFDSGMVASRGAVFPDEQKAVMSIRSREGASCGAPESVNPVSAKTVVGEQTGEAFGAPNRGVSR
jgi:hypothetical protein